MNTALAPKIYVACLAAYNHGYLHGAWIEATQDEKTVYETICTMLAASPIPHAEEWSIHDYEEFGTLTLDENESIQSVCDTAAFIQEHGALGGAALRYYGDLESAEEAINHHYQGEWQNEVDFASHLFDECYVHSIPANLQAYIDYEMFSRDLFINDYVSLEVGGMTHVF